MLRIAARRLAALPTAPPKALPKAARKLATIPAVPYIWHNGSLRPWNECNVHILSTAVQFGSSLFEGMRC